MKSKSRQDPVEKPATRALRNIPAKPAVPEPEIQTGHGRGAARDERTKRLLKQHPKRDEPLIDSVEPDEIP
jgi:hypothetical protein